MSSLHDTSAELYEAACAEISRLKEELEEARKTIRHIQVLTTAPTDPKWDGTTNCRRSRFEIADICGNFLNRESGE